MRGYAVTLKPDDDGSLLATCPALPEVTSFGETRTEALARAGLAIEEAIAARLDDWDEAPEPQERGGAQDFAPLPTHVLMKIMLYRALRAQGLTRADLQRRLGWHREQVDRLFRVSHASRLDQIDAALKAIGYGVNVTLEPAMADAP